MAQAEGIVQPSVVIGDPDGDHISVSVLSRMHEGADDYWDGNWLISPIELVVGCFRATIGAGLRAEELKKLREGLEQLNATLKGEAQLESLEGWISLRVVVDRRGGIVIIGRAVDRPGGKNELSFEIGGLDQSYLQGIIAALREVEVLFPVVGAP